MRGPVGEVEHALLEALVEDRETVAIPPQHFESVAAAIAEHEEVPTCRRLLEDRLHHAREPVERSSHVGRLEAEEDAYGGGKTKHRALRPRPHNIEHAAKVGVVEDGTDAHDGVTEIDLDSRGWVRDGGRRRASNDEFGELPS